MLNYGCVAPKRTHYNTQIYGLLKCIQRHLILHCSTVAEQISREGVGEDSWNRRFIMLTSSALFSLFFCSFLFRHMVGADNYASSIPEIGREQKENKVALLFFHPLSHSCLLSLRETREAIPAHWLLTSWNDYIQLHLIICIQLYSRCILLKICVFLLGFLNVAAKNPSGLRQETGLTAEHLGNKTSPGLSQQTGKQRRVAAGLVFGVTHLLFTQRRFLFGTTMIFPMGFVWQQVIVQ